MTPRFRPDRRADPRDVLFALVIEDGRTWGEAATDIQVKDAFAFLNANNDAPRYHYVTRARGYSKTADAAGYWIADALTCPPGAQSYFLAADAEQGALALDSIRGYLSRTLPLAGKFEVQARKVVCVDTGALLNVLPADAPSAWGLRPRNVFVDEFAQWAEGETSRALWLAVKTSLPKNPAARLLVITTSGNPDHPAYAELEHARRDPRWRTSETEGPPPWMSTDALDEQRAALPAGIFEQLFENRWVAVEGAFLDPAEVEAAFVHEGPTLARNPSYTYTAGLDLGTVNDAAVLAVVHAEGQTLHLDYMMRWTGTRHSPVSLEAVAASVQATHARFRFSKLYIDPWQATLMIERLQRFHGVRCAESYLFTVANKGHLASTLWQAFRSGSLALYPAPRLRDELLGLRLVPLPGGAGAAGAFGFDHARNKHDDTVVALALALAAAGAASPREGRSISLLDDGTNVPTIKRGDLTLIGTRYRDKQ